MADLDEILSGTESSSQPRDEQGRFASAPPAEPTPPAEPVSTPEPTPEPPPAQTAEPPPGDDRVPQAALLDERRKRQELERRLAEYEARQAPAAAPAPAPVEEDDLADLPDMFEDPKGYAKAFEQRIIAKAEIRAANYRANRSEEDARERWADYEDKRKVFAERLQNDPNLRTELNRHVYGGGDLGKFVYKTATALQELQQVRELGSIEALVEKRVAERLAKMPSANTPNVPQSLNTTASPATSTESWAGPTPLDQILKRK